jgi:hypothetical protein
MNRWLRVSALVVIAGLFAFVAAPGCDKGAKKGDTGQAKDKEKGKEHDHGETGPHGGPLAEWADIYHAEFTVDHAKKQVVVYILDDKAKAAPKIDAAKISKVKLTILDTKPLLQLDLTHDAKLSGEKGIAFTVTDDYFSKATDFKGNIKGVVEGTPPFSGDFTYKAPKSVRLFRAPDFDALALIQAAKSVQSGI